MHRVLFFAALAACHPEESAPPTDGADPTGTDTDTERPPATPRCRPVLVPTTKDPVIEGDSVALELSCTTGATGEAYAARLVAGPEGAAFDPATWTVTFGTGLADAGPRQVYVTVDVEGGVAENAAYTVWVNDAGPGVEGNVPPDPAVYTEEFGLPVIWCQPSGAVGADFVAAPCAVDGKNYPTSRMRVDGPAYPKPSYLVDFGALPLDGTVLDMNEKTALALLTTFDDNSYVRQKLAHDLWKELEDFWEVERPTSDTTFVVLYMAGEYAGLYVAADPVDTELMVQQGLLGSGDLYRSVSADANFSRMDALGAPKADLSAGWTQVAGGDTADLEALTAWAADSAPDVFASEAASWIRTDEFMDWFLLASFAAAPGSAGDRAYVYDGGTPREFRYIPGDFAGSFGQGVATERVPVDTFHDLRSENRIFDQLQASPQLEFVLRGRYEQVVAPGGPLDAVAIADMLDEYYADIDPAARRDEARWGAEYAAWWSARPDLTDHEAEKVYLYEWVAGRRAAYDAARP